MILIEAKKKAVQKRQRDALDKMTKRRGERAKDALEKEAVEVKQREKVKEKNAELREKQKQKQLAAKRSNTC